ncbi:MAG: hypothetical protein ACR5KW_04230 [Wolbachia sp.]
MQLVGYKIHVYISPHLINFNEKVIVAESNINDNELYSFLEKCCNAITDQSITLIEIDIDERLDATNIIDNLI